MNNQDNPYFVKALASKYSSPYAGDDFFIVEEMDAKDKIYLSLKEELLKSTCCFEEDHNFIREEGEGELILVMEKKIREV